MSRKHRKSEHGEGKPAHPEKPVPIRSAAPLSRKILGAALALAAVVLLCAALPVWPARFDLALKALVFVCALITAYVAYDERRTGWALILGLVAIGFNPVWPLNLSRGNWVATYLVVGAVFVAAAARFRRPPQGIFRARPRIP